MMKISWLGGGDVEGKNPVVHGTIESKPDGSVVYGGDVRQMEWRYKGFESDLSYDRLGREMTAKQLRQSAREKLGHDPTDVELLNYMAEVRPAPTSDEVIRFILASNFKRVREEAEDEELTDNVFCKTGKGGGVDPTCGKDGKSRAAQHEIDDAGRDKSFRQAFTELFPKLKNYTTNAMADKMREMTGLPMGAKVTVYPSFTSSGGGINVFMEDGEGPSGITISRRIFRDGPDLVCGNTYFFIAKNKRGEGGAGTRIFNSQVNALTKMGVSEIRTEMGRSEGPDGMNGYYTWPRLGYQAPVPQATQDRLRTVLGERARVSTVRDLMMTQRGRDAWKEHGGTLNGTFDLRTGSGSLGVLSRYVAAKKKEK